MLAGIGVAGTVAGKRLQVSSPAGLAAGTLDADWRQRVDALENEGKTVVVVQEESRVLGLLALRDTLRSDAPLALSRLKTLNIRCVMLTGDNPRAAAAIAGELGIDFRAGLLPADKVTAIGELNRQRPTAMVGTALTTPRR